RTCRPREGAAGDPSELMCGDVADPGCKLFLGIGQREAQHLREVLGDVNLSCQSRARSMKAACGCTGRQQAEQIERSSGDACVGRHRRIAPDRYTAAPDAELAVEGETLDFDLEAS